MASSVLIVGAGPAGLTLACELFRRGIPCRIIDEKEHGTDIKISKAVAVHAKTLEFLEQMGVVDQFTTQGLKLLGINISDGENTIAEIETTNNTDITKYDFSISIAQGTTESILNEKLEQLGGKIERKVSLKEIAQDEAGVNAVLVHHKEDGEIEEKCHFEYLVGCDGAHSKTRHLLGIEFEGSQYSEHFILADVMIDNINLRPGFGQAVLAPKGIFFIFPLPMHPNYYRIVLNSFEKELEEVPTTEHKGEILHGINPNSQVTLERVQAEVNSILPKANLHSPGWLTSFRISKRLAKNYQVGRVFLAGDAAHIHAPTGGQGMNTGMQDAVNLAWKLALVLHKISPKSLLNSYGVERRWVAQTVLQNTHGATTLVSLKSTIAQSIRNRFLGFISSIPLVQQKIGLTTSMLNLNYRDSGSPIILDTSAGIFGSYAHVEPGKLLTNALFNDGTRLFDRLALKDSQDTKHKLIILVNSAESLQEVTNSIEALDKRKQLEVIAVLPTGASVNSNQFPVGRVIASSEVFDLLGNAYKSTVYIVRPDFFVGFFSQPLDGNTLKSYLDRIFL